MNREEWLNEGLKRLREDFASTDFILPEGIRVTCGWPSKSALAAKRKRVGECWSSDCSKDGHFEIFISPYISDSVEALAILVHESVHAAVGLECKHKGAFKTCALAMGLEGKMTETNASEGLKVRLRAIIEEIGEYPHATLDKLAVSNAPPKQSTRMHKVVCPMCEYTIRVSQKWLDIGTPTCPCGEPMVADGEPKEEEESDAGE